MKRILFFTFLCVFLISFSVLEMQQSDGDVIKEKLLEMGYPEKGYVICNGTIKYSDGSFVVLSTPPKRYSISAIDAYNLAKNYLRKKEQEYGLSKYNYHLRIDVNDLEEYEDNNGNYWTFKMYFGKGAGKGDLMGWILVDRANGRVKMKGMFGG